MLKEKLELLLERCGERDVKQRDFSYQELVQEVQGATTSVTSVPKPLKFLSKHYKTMCEMYDKLTDRQF
jgi:26S proteasome regulatory subunit N1